MTNALTGPFIQALGYTKGRTLVQSDRVQWLVAHTAEGADDEIALGNFFANTRNGSSNCGIGQDGGYAQYVNYADTPWAAPPLNQEGEHVELCGFARWTRDEWLAHPAMLETFAQWLAWRAAVRGIPLVLLTADDLRAGKPGVVDHRTVNLVYKMSDHWDVGYNLPWDVVLPRARQLGGVAPVVNPAPVPTPAEPTNPFGRPLLKEDGLLGPKSIEEAQRQTGTPADGVISTPKSTFVTSVQLRLNALGFRDYEGKLLLVDGAGIYSNSNGDTAKTRTISAFQRYLGTPIDRYFSGPPTGSSAVRALQHRLNTGTLW